MRGFISGLIWGGVAMGLLVATVSLIAPLAPRPDVASEISAPAMTRPEAPAAEVPAPGNDADLVDTPPSVPRTADSDGTADVAGPAGDPTSSAGKPEVAVAPEQPIAGPGVSGAPDIGNPSDSPPNIADPSAVASPGNQTQAPEVETATVPEAPGVGRAPQPVPQPQPESDVAQGPDQEMPVLPTDPVVMPEPSMDAAPAVSLTPASKPADAVPPIAAQTSKQEGTAPQIETTRAPARHTFAVEPPVLPAESDAQPEVARASVAPPRDPAVSEAKPDPVPEASEAPEAATNPAPAEQSDVATRNSSLPVIEPASESDQPDDGSAPRTATLPQAGAPDTALVPRIGQPVIPLTDRTEAPAATPTVEPPEAPAADAPAIARFAAPFDNPEDKPLMSIVLIDDPRAIGIEALREFPYPLTFAVDPLDPDAAARMARHRANGFEVVALVDLPQAATAQDVEVALSASLTALPDTVALLEGTTSGFQGNRAQSDQVSAYAQATGRGLITQGNGLNTAQKLALRNGVPALPVFRDFDGAGQTPTVMRRFLDQAAFRARQEGGVIMLGRVRPDTISALLLWGLQDRANRVALAPVSAVLAKAVDDTR
ncbi:divergent polysaccharide deacetylase family protein [Arenibacterium halophilum]|nr:divergent polysaccharide deacetylase family protein [Arenibacterium halophilum]